MIFVSILLGIALILFLSYESTTNLNNQVSNEENRHKKFVLSLTDEQLVTIFKATPMSNLYNTEPVLVDFLLTEKQYRGL